MRFTKINIKNWLIISGEISKLITTGTPRMDAIFKIAAKYNLDQAELIKKYTGFSWASFKELNY